MAQSDSEEPKRLQLRRYSNRRYYDATRSQHVTLEQVYQLICEGYDIEVVDYQSGEDITTKVLAQVILDHDPPKLEVFPAELLHRLIRSNEQIFQDFTEKYFNQALDAFLQSQRAFEQHLRQFSGLSAEQPSAANWPANFMAPFVQNPWMPKPADKAAPSTPAEGDEVRSLRETVERLSQQLSALQSRLPDKPGSDS